MGNENIPDGKKKNLLCVYLDIQNDLNRLMHTWMQGNMDKEALSEAVKNLEERLKCNVLDSHNKSLECSRKLLIVHFGCFLKHCLISCFRPHK